MRASLQDNGYNAKMEVQSALSGDWLHMGYLATSGSLVWLAPGSSHMGIRRTWVIWDIVLVEAWHGR